MAVLQQSGDSPEINTTKLIFDTYKMGLESFFLKKQLHQIRCLMSSKRSTPCCVIFFLQYFCFENQPYHWWFQLKVGSFALGQGARLEDLKDPFQSSDAVNQLTSGRKMGVSN